jgi:ATP-dependent Clp protease ATP-binding subunit ClpC
METDDRFHGWLIPPRWRERLVKGREIRSVADRLHAASTTRTASILQQTGVNVSRWTDRAKLVLALSGEAAHIRLDGEMDSRHLLLGMVRERNGVAGNVLYNMGVDFPWLKEKVNMLFPAGSDSRGSVRSSRHSDLESVIEQAHGAAKELGHNYVGTEHLLLGIVRVPDCSAVRLLRNLGIDPDAVGREVVALLASGPGPC